MEKGNTATEESTESSGSDGETTATDGGMTAVTDSGGGGGSSAHPPASATLTNPDGSTITSETDAEGNKSISRTDEDGNPVGFVEMAEDLDDADTLRESGFDYGQATNPDGSTTARASGHGMTGIEHIDGEGNVIDSEIRDDET